MGDKSPFAIFHQDVDAVHADLYDGLLIQSLLQHDPTRLPSSVRRNSPNASQDIQSEWHRFLDDLCFLCDSQSGGKSVVALIAEEVRGESVFWVTTEPVHQDVAVDHLNVILHLLQKCIRADEGRMQALIEQIAQISIRRSPQRVHHYGSRLKKVTAERPTEACAEGQPIGTCTDTAPYEALDQIIAVRHLHQHLCESSYLFRYKDDYGLLKQHIKPTSKETWNRVRHFVGRLGHWHKTAISLARAAASFASMLPKFRVAAIPCPDLGIQAHFTLDEDLEALVLRVFPNYRGTPLCDRLVDRISRAKALIDWYRTNELVPRPHAEVVALEYCHSRSMHLVNDDRYVGCSKPSCYCCSLYIGYHPGAFRPRPSHNNVWVQWCLPQAFHLELSGTANLGILRRMANDTRDLLKATLTNGTTASRRRFDSTTGISTTVIGPD
ncbi:hypothetical protein LTS16_009839 [Friedmanniomyces endolithicus]|nr:hypothetical protein LTR57_017559 [Friedmanniomyces endolithicus]KAK0950728.1 hypothetical protein LTS01_025505 [Friedmanniomyces endolithicus]KAK1041074.1 hypothetical protein LTS16_009839 [Friedmanniomyces endolithicus]